MRSNKGHFKGCNAVIEKQDQGPWSAGCRAKIKSEPLKVPGVQGYRAKTKSEPLIVEMDGSNGALHPYSVTLHATRTRIEDPDIDKQEKGTQFNN